MQPTHMHSAGCKCRRASHTVRRHAGSCPVRVSALSPVLSSTRELPHPLTPPPPMPFLRSHHAPHSPPTNPSAPQQVQGVRSNRCCWPTPSQTAKQRGLPGTKNPGAHNQHARPGSTFLRVCSMLPTPPPPQRYLAQPGCQQPCGPGTCCGWAVHHDPVLRTSAANKAQQQPRGCAKHCSSIKCWPPTREPVNGRHYPYTPPIMPACVAGGLHE